MNIIRELLFRATTEHARLRQTAEEKMAGLKGILVLF